MKAPLKWLKEHADFEATAKQFADGMTMSGSKVEYFEREADGIDKVVIGKIIAIEKHPNADKLLVCTVDIGGKNIVVVTGAKNLKEGDLCPVALDGATLPGGVKIVKSDMRGVESDGMLCSLKELGLTKHDFPAAVEDGIMTLDEPAQLGADACAVLGLDDYCFDFEITSNRPDCLSVIGLAQEAAATFGGAFKQPVPALPAGTDDINKFLKVKIDDNEGCLRYIAAMVTDIKIAPSPRWLRERLRLCGVRPINNIVDITNYVMLEYGHPMHAFDYKYVQGGEIIVRRAKTGENITTLDGAKRELTTDMLCICDAEEPIGIAGVMGGEYSGVYETTQKIVFESACFDGPTIRATARKLNLRTEASGRYEKGLNPGNCAPAIMRALELVVQLGAGKVINGLIDVYPNPRENRKVKFDAAWINKFLGIDVAAEKMLGYLKAVGLGVEGENIIVPPNRYDIMNGYDLAEEVARMYGYDNVPSTPILGAAAARPTQRATFKKMLTNELADIGCFECKTYSFYSPKALDNINLPQNSPLRNTVKIMNPLGEDTSIMRTTAIPSMLDVVARNINARTPYAALFEDATEYLPRGATELPSEVEKFIIAAYGEEQGYDYYFVKGLVERLLKAAKIADYEVVKNTEGVLFHPTRAAYITVGGKKLCELGEVHPAVLENYGIKQRVCVADVDFGVLYDARGGTPQYAPLPKFPAIERDIALVVDKDVEAGTLLALIKAACGDILQSASVFDVYVGDRVESGKKSIAFNIVLRNNARTLTDDEADAAVALVVEQAKTCGAVLRA